MYIILFDGVCNFCNSTVNFIIDRDTKGQFAFAPLQSERGRALLQTYLPSALAADQATLSSVVLIKEGKAYQKSTAVLQIVRHLNGLWPLCYAAIVLPRFIRDYCYDLIARNRYRWFGKAEACRLPTPELRQRFLA